MPQELRLFIEILSLVTIISHITLDELATRNKTITRKNFQSLKSYLAENLHNYEGLKQKDLKHLIYEIGALITLEVCIKMYRFFVSRMG